MAGAPRRVYPLVMCTVPEDVLLLWLLYLHPLHPVPTQPPDNRLSFLSFLMFVTRSSWVIKQVCSSCVWPLFFPAPETCLHLSLSPQRRRGRQF